MKSYKYNVVKSGYDAESGESFVTINTDVGTFTGTAQCHPEEERPSNMFGCQVAEGRALDKYLRELVKIAKARQKELNNLYTTFSDWSGFNEDNYYTSKVRRALYALSGEIDDLERKRVQLTQRIKAMCVERDIIISENKKRHAKK